jgi:hypothetical protein
VNAPQKSEAAEASRAGESAFYRETLSILVTLDF